MKSSIISISEVLNTAESLISVGFSDGYNFSEAEASEYFEELIENSSLPTPIFSGILILEQSEKTFTIIDGLQRITTICLLFCALCENYKGTSKNNEESRNKLLERFLLTNAEPKLKLTSAEHQIYKKILFSQELSKEEQNNHLYKTYAKFLEKMKEHRISGTKLFKIISRIQFMTIITDKSEISAGDLYQTLNENKNKAQINLITDFIAQRDRKALNLWVDVINQYKSFKVYGLLENFIRDFLTVQNDGKIPEMVNLYNNFKSWFAKISVFQDAKTAIENLCKYSRYYLKIINLDFEQGQIREQLEILNQNQGTDAYPYLMEVLDDYENGHIDLEIFVNILMMINSFVVQREQNVLSGITVDFATLSKEINKMLILKDYVPQIIDENKLTINEINQLSTFEV